jgi:hypothetical protein
MRAQRQRARVLRRERMQQLCPQQARGAQLRHLHEKIHADAEEERQPRRKPVDGEPGGKSGAHIFDAIGERIGEFQILRRARFLHVVAGDRDRVELRHVGRGVGENVGDDAQRGARRVDVGVAHHELFEDVVLDGAAELFRRHPLLLGGDDIQRHHRQHRAVHGHRHGHPVERDAGEQGAHVVDRIDRNARHADVAGDPRVIRVVAAVGGEIEGDRQALLPGGEIAAVEGIGVLGGREAGVLPDGPWLGHVHRGIRPAKVRWDARPGIEAIETGDVFRPIYRIHRDAFRRQPGLSRADDCRVGAGPAESNAAEIRNPGHRCFTRP